MPIVYSVPVRIGWSSYIKRMTDDAVTSAASCNLLQNWLPKALKPKTKATTFAVDNIALSLFKVNGFHLKDQVNSYKPIVRRFLVAKSLGLSYKNSTTKRCFANFKRGEVSQIKTNSQR